MARLMKLPPVASTVSDHRATPQATPQPTPQATPQDLALPEVILPDCESAVWTTTLQQRIFFLILLLAAVGYCLAGRWRAVNVLNELFLAFYGVVLFHRATTLIAGALSLRTRWKGSGSPRATARRRGRRRSHSSLQAPMLADGNAEETLPTVSILIPLYREGRVLQQIVGAIERLDYPRSRLQTLLLLEADDGDTRSACEELSLPPNFEVVITPPGRPRTKPRACNYGLKRCRGEITVIFDAEDQPERDQLRLAAEALRRADPDVACLQAKLSYYNPRQNLLTRCFAAEYLSWFELMLPGLESLGAPIPLGGTSNYFRTSYLREVGGWDAWNVAEDCDLGMRLYRRGRRVALLDSTTWEEACPTLDLWLRQRSRWIKGYLQSWLVHNRRPVQLLQELGPWKWIHLQLLVGGSVLCLLLNPVYWALTALWWLHPTAIESAVMSGPTLFLGNIAFSAGNLFFILIHLSGALRRRQWDLVAWSIVVPIYWLAMSAAAWKALWQLVWAPHFWEKTVHGLAQMPAADPLPAASAEEGRAEKATLLLH